MADRDRPTNPDELRPKPDDTLPDQERQKREAASAMRQAGERARRMTGADRAQVEQRRETPKGLPVPQRPTLTGLAPPGSPADEPYGRPQSFPPPISEPRKATPQSGTAAQGDRRQPIPVILEEAPSSRAPTKGDWRKLGFKVATAVVAGLVLIIGALALWAYTAIGARTEAIKAVQEEKRKAESAQQKWRDWAAVAIWILDCRDERNVETGEMLRPDPQKMGNARRPEAWKNGCPTKLPPPP